MDRQGDEQKKQLVRYYDRVLEEEAIASAARAAEAKQRDQVRTHAAASFNAIVDSASAVEFYLSEILAHLAQVDFIKQKERKKILGKDRPWKRLNALAKRFGTPISGESFYPRYEALVRLRNALIHRSAEFYEPGRWPEEIDGHQGVIAHVSGDGLDWTSQILDAGTAEWAVEVMRAVVDRMHEIVPDPGELSAE